MCSALKKKRRKIYYITLNVKNVLCEELRRAKEKRTTSNGKRQQRQTGEQRRKCSRLVFPPPLRSVAFFLLQSSLDCRYLLWTAGEIEDRSPSSSFSTFHRVSEVEMGGIGYTSIRRRERENSGLKVSVPNREFCYGVMRCSSAYMFFGNDIDRE